MPNRTSTTIFLASLLALAAIPPAARAVQAADAPAGTVTASRPVVLRDGKGSMYPAVAEAPKGGSLRVISKEGKWLRVEFNGKQGWVSEIALKGGGSTNAFSEMSKGLAAVSGQADTSETQYAAAGKGVGEGVGLTADNYAAAKGLSTDGLERMVATRQQVIDSGEWQRFAQEGGVGPAAK